MNSTSDHAAGGLPFHDAEAVMALGSAAAVRALEDALRGGLDPAQGVPRSFVPLDRGELILMPAQTPGYAGVKLATVAPGNTELGLPRISAVYVMFEAGHLRPAAVLDGTALTTLRTPAVSVAAVRPYLERVERPWRVVVFGVGPQGLGHVDALAAQHPLASVDLVVRTPGDRPGPAAGPEPRWLVAGTPEVEDALRRADVVVCATTSRSPLFDPDLLGPQVVVMAVGSHEPDAQEVDSAFCARALVVVEDVETALREGGDVVQAVAAGVFDHAALVTMAAVARGEAPSTDGPVFFKGSGMSWEDLVVAEAVLATALGEDPAG